MFITPADEEQRKRTNKVRCSGTDHEPMVKTSAAPSVCYQNHEGETVKKEPEETKRGGKFGGDAIQHYIRTDLRVPSVTGAANCFHSESKGNNVHLNERLFDVAVEIHTNPSFVPLSARRVYFTSL